MVPTPSEEQQAVYRLAFVQNCLALLLRGYSSLKASSLQTAEEPHITGELVKCTRDLLEGDAAEAWMEPFEVLDDPPQNVPGRYGKSRPRIDIEFVQTVRRRRPRFHIEAKRLYRSDSINEYFGAEGLQMFANGVYAADQSSAGMLGYVQADDSGTWMLRLERGFGIRLKQLGVCRDRPTWAAASWDGEGLGAVRTTCHERASARLGRLEIYHLLLEFL